MTEEKKPVQKQSKKTIASKKVTPKVEKPTKKRILSEGDLVKDAEGKEFVFVRHSRKDRVVLREKNSNVVVVVDKSLIIK